MVTGACARSRTRLRSLRRWAGSRMVMTRRSGLFGCSPDGAAVATVAVITPGEQPHRVMLPAPMCFTANTTRGEQRECKIEELDGAITDSDGNVQLRDGS